jgi:hypothetical protein
MAQIGELTAKITLDTSGFNRQIGIAEKRASNFASTLGGKFKKNIRQGIEDLSKLSIAATGVALAFGASAVDAAKDAEEISAKFRTVFGDVESQAESTAKTLAKSYGLSRVEAEKLLAGTGDLLTGFGFTDKGALDLSKSVQELAVDLASFQNLEGGAAQASEALTKGLLGEREMLKSLGVVISEEDLKNQLLIDGKSELTGLAMRQARAEATYKLILQQTGKAQGDFARTQDSLANKMRITKARFDDIRVSIGKRLIPVAEKILEIVEKMLPAFERLVDRGLERLREILNDLEPLFQTIKGFAEDLLNTLFTNEEEVKEFAEAFFVIAAAVTAAAIAFGLLTGPIVLAIAVIAALAFAWVKLKDTIVTIIETLVSIIAGYIDFMRRQFEMIISIMTLPFRLAFEIIKGILTGDLKGAFENAKDILRNTWSKVQDAIISPIIAAKNFVLGALEDMANEGIRFVNRLIDAVNKIPGVSVGKIGLIGAEGEKQQAGFDLATKGTSKKLKSVVGFADGGIMDSRIIPGNSFSGDKLNANINSGEMVLNREDQAKLFSMIKSGSGGGNREIINNVNVYNNTDFEIFNNKLKLQLGI